MSERQNAYEKPLSPWDYHDFAHRQFAQERQKEELRKQSLLEAAQKIVEVTVKELEKENGHQPVS